MNFFITLPVLFLLPLKVDGVVSESVVDDLKYLTLDRKNFDKIRNIHSNWYLFSIKALLSQIAKEFLKTATPESATMLKECLRRITRSKDITMTARCLINARESQEKLSFTFRFETLTKKRKKRIWLKDVVRLNFYRTKDDNRLSKVSEKVKSNRKRRRRLKRSPHRLIISHKSDTDFLEIKTQHAAPALMEAAAASPAHRLSDLFISLFSNVSLSKVPAKWSTTYKKMLELNRKLDGNSKLPGAQVYNRRIYDIVMKEKQDDKESYEPVVPPFLKSIVDIVKSFNKGGSARVLSPRVAPLLPDKASSSGFLSPSLFPFYKDDTEDQILPIPKLLEDSGLNINDRERVLEMIMELSGARETVNKAMKVLDNLSALGVGEEFLRVGNKIYDSFERLRSSLNHDQSHELEERGFTFMGVEQMKTLHKEQGLEEPQVDAQVEQYGNLSKVEREKALWETIAEIAGLSHLRSKRQAIPGTVLAPIVLSPYQFAPVIGFTVLGPVVLSPNIFSPLILNPSLLSPYVLSPSFPLPFILSPYLFSPYVLSPLLMAPFILSPYMIAPNVINPYVLSPLVLSPLLLCPDVLSPMVLGGTILSPALLSPSVLSKSYVMANVLSPTLLS